MRVLLTGGCGDLGKILAPRLAKRGDEVILMDLHPPDNDTPAQFIDCSIVDREKLKAELIAAACDTIVHIAAWHGIHEFKKEKDAYDFFDLNIKGTFEVFEASVNAGVKRIVFISSTSVDEPNSVYGNSKIIAEQIASFYAAHHNIGTITLRPRAFIPHWNRVVYSDYIEWAKWFWKGAVHIEDVAQSVEKSIDFLEKNYLEQNLILTVDGAYEFSDEDLKNWDQNGPGTTFRKYYEEYFDLTVLHGLSPFQSPRKLDISAARQAIGYAPTYSLRNVLEELAQYGADGPPAPFQER